MTNHMTEIQKIALKNLDKSTHTTRQALNLIDIVGVISGIKSAALVEYDATQETLTKWTGLIYERSISDMAVVSFSSDIANKLLALHKLGRTDKSGQTDRAIGKLLGYPETATEYFLKRLPTVMRAVKDQLPVVIPAASLDTVQGSFQQFILSPEAWAEEIAAYSVPLEVAMRELTPRSYQILKRQAQRDRWSKRMKNVIGIRSREDYDSTIINVKIVK